MEPLAVQITRAQLTEQSSIMLQLTRGPGRMKKGGETKPEVLAHAATLRWKSVEMDRDHKLHELRRSNTLVVPGRARELVSSMLKIRLALRRYSLRSLIVA